MGGAANSRGRPRKLVRLGKVSGAHGVRGWVRVNSLTEPPAAILDYQPWLLGENRESVRFRESRAQGRRIFALLEEVEDRDQAEALTGKPIAVYRDQLPEPEPGQFYWTDLIGLPVVLEDGRKLGTIERMLATGANDVMVVRGDRERLVPFVIGQYVKQVDLEGGLVTVDWDPDF